MEYICRFIGLAQLRHKSCCTGLILNHRPQYQWIIEANYVNSFYSTRLCNQNSVRSL